MKKTGEKFLEKNGKWIWPVVAFVLTLTVLSFPLLFVQMSIVSPDGGVRILVMDSTYEINEADARAIVKDAGATLVAFKQYDSLVSIEISADQQKLGDSAQMHKIADQISGGKTYVIETVPKWFADEYMKKIYEHEGLAVAGGLVVAIAVAWLVRKK